MADQVLSWGEVKAGVISFKAIDNGDNFSIPTVDLGPGEGVSVLLTEILNGKYKLIYVDNEDGTYSPAAGIVIVPPPEGEVMIISGSGTTVADGTWFCLFCDVGPMADDPTINANVNNSYGIFAPTSDIVVTKILANCNAPGIGETSEFILWVEGADSGISVTISGNETQGSAAFAPLTITAGQRCAIKTVLSASSSTNVGTTSIEATIPS